jgi:hypothetical protein
MAAAAPSPLTAVSAAALAFATSLEGLSQAPAAALLQPELASIAASLAALSAGQGTLLTGQAQLTADVATLTSVVATLTSGQAKLTADVATLTSSLRRTERLSTCAYNAGCGEGVARPYKPVPNDEGAVPQLLVLDAAAFKALTPAAINTLLAFYGIPVLGSAVERRDVLKSTLGITVA